MADLGNRANVNSAIDLLLDDLQPDEAIQPSDHNVLLKDVLDTLANGLSTVLRTGNTTDGQNLTITSSSIFQFANGSNGRLQSDTLTAFRNWTLPDATGTIALLSDIPSSVNIYTDDGTLTGDRTVDLNGSDLDFKDGNLSSTLTSYIGTSNPKGKFFEIPNNRAGYLDGSFWFRNLNNSTGAITPHHRFYSGGLPSYVGAGTSLTDKFSFGKTNNNSGAKFEMLAQSSGMFIHNNAPVTKSFLGLLHLYSDTGAGTVALNVENPIGSIIMARANANREVILRGTNVIGTEKISLQGSTLIKGDGTSTGSTLALYNNDTTPVKTWDFLDNGDLNGSNNRIKNTIVNPSVQETTSTATFTINADEETDAVLTAMASATSIASPTGTPVQGQKLTFRLKDDGTSRALTWNAIFRAIGLTLPTTTTANKTIYIGCMYNSTETKWDVIAIKEEV